MVVGRFSLFFISNVRGRDLRIAQMARKRGGGRRDRERIEESIRERGKKRREEKEGEGKKKKKGEKGENKEETV